MVSRFPALLCLLTGMLVGCGSSDRPIVLKAALSQNPGEPQVIAMQSFKRIVEERTDGRIQVRLYPNNQLGNQRDVVEGLQIGSIEVSNIASVMSAFVPETNLFELPFLFESPEHFDSVLDGSIGTTAEPIESLDDMRGLKIRTMENPLHLAAFRAFGANPLPMAYGELYTALEQGVIDGGEAADPNYFSKRFYEPAPFWARVGWIRLLEYVIMSSAFYERLTPDDRAIIDAAAREMILEQRALYRSAADSALAELRKVGVRVTYPDRRPFREAAREVYAAWAERVGGLVLIEEILGR
jgi:TRAP-type C4-dicarboxylate transport system substrate-binding protein